MDRSNIVRLQPEAAPFALEIEPHITTQPPLPAIDFSLPGQQAPVVQATPEILPQADVVIITWANAEWAAMEHVFCQSGVTMPYSARSTGNWSGWVEDTQNLPASTDPTWTHWGSYRLIEIADQPVLLYKSNTHLDWPGQSFLEGLVEHLIGAVQPQLILSIGTAGGTRVSDAIGTVVITHASTLYQQGSSSPTYISAWQARDTLLNLAAFSQLLLPIPTTETDLQALCDQFNAANETSYQLADLNADSLDFGASLPQIDDLTQGDVALLTTSSFVVGTTDGALASYACIEMDDAVIGEICSRDHVDFGSIRNISDPAQNAQLPASVQGGWGSVLYKAYGFYSSYNGALAAWAAVCAQLASGFGEQKL